MAVRWEAGAHVVVRNVWHGRVFSAYPLVVVEDTADLYDDLDQNALDSGIVPQVANQRPHLQVTASFDTLLSRLGSPAAEMEFSLPISSKTLERVDSPEQIDSWNRTWVFFEWWLRPYEDRSKPAPKVATGPGQ